MDAFKFCKEFERMCASYKECSACALFNETTSVNCSAITNISDGRLKKKIEVVEKWSKEHPPKTMAQDFFEKFPNAPKRINTHNIPQACPDMCGYCAPCCAKYIDCSDCWNRPLEG